MYKHTISALLFILLFGISHTALSKTYSKADEDKIRQILTKAGVDQTNEILLLRRMAARNVPVEIAIKWSEKLKEMNDLKLPVPIAVDRIQQGLIKNIKIQFIDKAINKLIHNINWSQRLLINKTMPKSTKHNKVDGYEKRLLNKTATNMEVAMRQGYKRNELAVAMSRKRVNLEMAAEISESITLWTNYGVDSDRVLLSIKRSNRLGFTPGQMQDLREKIDSMVVSDRVISPKKITRLIWDEIRELGDVMDAEHSFRSGMQHNPYSVKGAASTSGSDSLNFSDVEVLETNTSDSGGDVGGDIGSGSSAGDIGTDGGGVGGDTSGGDVGGGSDVGGSTDMGGGGTDMGGGGTDMGGGGTDMGGGGTDMGGGGTGMGGGGGHGGGGMSGGGHDSGGMDGGGMGGGGMGGH
ncbi:MAG: hypothetical protein OEY52_03045 [Gammaproteobacteria bacterium]|nr:hypothetical protein [Gammaproteobacteria bacterium]